MRCAILVLACCLIPSLGHTVLGAPLRLCYDFESVDPGEDGLLRRIPGHSANDFYLEFIGRPTAVGVVPTPYGHALRSAISNQALVMTDGGPIHRPGEGLTLSFWAAGEGWLRPMHVGAALGEPLIGVLLTLNRHSVGMRWSAVQDDDPGAPAFVVRGSLEFPTAVQWNHFAAVYDPGARLATVFINGDPEGMAEVEGNPIAGWGGPGRTAMKFAMTVIRRGEIELPNPPVQYIDELRMYARALTRHEIRGDMSMRESLHVSASSKLAMSWAKIKGR